MIATLLAAQSYGTEEPTVKKDKSPPLVVFVCEHGSAKSLVVASQGLQTVGLELPFALQTSTLRFKSGRRLQLNLLIFARELPQSLTLTRL